MNKNQKIKVRISFITFWFILIASFIFCSCLIILKANGYQLDWRYWRIVKTSMVILDGDPKDVEIRLNQKYIQNFPQKISNLHPGSYDIRVSKSGYQTWQKTVVLEEGKADVYQDIIIFLEEPKQEPLDQSYTSEKIMNDYKAGSSNISLKNNEIYYRDKLVSRFTGRILAASLYPDDKHIVFQENNEIKVIDIDGSNNFLLIRLESNEPTMFTFANNAHSIIYIDNGKINSAKIR